MAYLSKIVLISKNGDIDRLDEMVEQFITDGVRFIGVVGVDCSRIEDTIDEIAVGDGLIEPRYILTSAHPNETVEQVIAFSDALTGEFAGPCQIVEL